MMRITVYTLLLAPALLVAAALTAQPASAASRVNVPFDFVAGSKTCPAGTYFVSQRSDGNTLEMQGPKDSFVWVAGLGVPSPTDTRTILTFDLVGARHMLRTVQYRATITNRLDRQIIETIPMPQQTVTGQ